MTRFIVLMAAISLSAPLAQAKDRALSPSAKNLDISNDEDPAEFAQDLLEMGIDGQVYGYTPSEQKSRLSVFIDKTTQTITVTLDDRIIMQDKVSTGGTLKSPNNPKNPKPPRCANTPEYKMYIPANNSTMFPVWKSNTYVNSETFEPVAMPFAIHIEAGFFLHQVPPGMEKYLGYAVSGGCIRLPAKVAPALYNLMKQYGGINLEISGANPSPVNNPPPYNHICKKDANGVAVKVPVKGGQIADQQNIGRPHQPLYPSVPKREETLLEKIDVFGILRR